MPADNSEIYSLIEPPESGNAIPDQYRLGGSAEIVPSEYRLQTNTINPEQRQQNPTQAPNIETGERKTMEPGDTNLLLSEFYDSGPHSIEEVMAHKQAISEMQQANTSVLVASLEGKNMEETLGAILDAQIDGQISPYNLPQVNGVNPEEFQEYVSRHANELHDKYLRPTPDTPVFVEELVNISSKVPSPMAKPIKVATLPGLAGEWDGKSEVWYGKYRRALNVLQPDIDRNFNSLTEPERNQLLSEWDENVARAEAYSENRYENNQNRFLKAGAKVEREDRERQIKEVEAQLRRAISNTLIGTYMEFFPEFNREDIINRINELRRN